MNDIDESEAKVMFERLEKWIRLEYGEELIDLALRFFSISRTAMSDSLYNEQDIYKRFLFGYNYDACPEYNNARYHVRSIFEIAEQHLTEHRLEYNLSEQMKNIFRKLAKLKGVGSLAELELRLAAMGEN